MKIIGISGTNASGKDTAAALLAKKHGFYSAIATDMLTAELNKRGQPTERENKRTLSAEWRREHGLGVIVDKAVAEAKAAGFDKLVVSSLRNSGEVERVHELGGQVIWIDSDPKIRYKRIQKANRNRVEDAKTYEQFLAEEQAEMQHSGDAATLNMAAVKQLADIYIDNQTDTIDDFIEAVEKQIQDLL